MKKTLLVLLFLCFNFISVSSAKDFGNMGAVYEILERDLLEEIHDKLMQAKKDGRLDQFQKKVKEDMILSLKRPEPLKNITKAQESRSWFFDPSISKDHDLYDQNGRIFYKAYTKVNPLDKINLTKTLIFIDGDDKEQISFALAKNKEEKGAVKIILVNGAIIELMEKYKIRLYFDQNARLTTKFNIKFVPATIKQEGKSLRISEVAI